MTPKADRATPAVVGVGASAGGLEAFSRLLESLPADTGMAFVLVQHLDPKHPSLLSHLLSAKTAMTVSEATDDADLLPDHVYVVPPGADLLIAGQRLRLTPREQDTQPHLPIDAFLRSLAEDAGERAIGVILSGAASDGAQGLAAIKSGGGVTFAQDPRTAEYSSMPSSAISSRVVDFVLSPEEIAAELARLGAGSGSEHRDAPEAAGDGEPGALDRVFALLRAAFQVDFSAYKLPTIRRRIARRMLVRHVTALEEYVALLTEDPAEVDALYRDILIMVTEFFREPETFAVLRERVIPGILNEKEAGDSVRIWVPGCASGEEAYSLAITLLEVMDEQRMDVAVKIFATDISEPDLAVARRGVYSANVSAAVAPDLLRRYFIQTESGHQIAKSVRELCVFARHDVTSDPPFPNLDLVSCRNLLIYLGSALQRRVIPMLHYGLRPGGHLVLGRSESIGAFAELFEAVDKKQKIYRKLSSVAALGLYRFPTGSGSVAPPRQSAPPEVERRGSPAPVASEDADKAVLSGFAPPGVTVDPQHMIVEFRGDTDSYLEHRPGRPSLNLLDLVRDDIAGKVRAALSEAERTGAKAVLRGVRMGTGKTSRAIDLHVIPFTSEGGDAYYVVLFDETSDGKKGARNGPRSRRLPEASEVDRLRDELIATRERLEAVIQDKEAANEELRAANEEMLSSGEEMQSINEELETTQEELQSTNQELRSRNLELGQVSDDLSNLLTSVSFPIIMVGRDLRIRRFTPAAARLLKVIPSDIGRLITDLRLRIDVPDLEDLLTEVIQTMALTERDVQDDQGRWYAMQVRPYKTLDNRIDGAVLTLFDIDEMKRLFAAEKRLSMTLQQHYLHALPDIDGLELAIATETAHHHDLIGGDFHDVFALPDGRVLALIGDAAGKGVEAAGAAETVRVATRATALASASPQRILRISHKLVEGDSDRFVTALVVVLDPTCGEVVMASAGHVPPAHVSGAGCVLVEPRFGLPLGSLASEYPPQRFTIERGDVLVLYTDGVVEARRDGELFGEERLLEVLSGAGQRDPQVLVTRLREAVLDFADELQDDVQILALRLV